MIAVKNLTSGKLLLPAESEAESGHIIKTKWTINIYTQHNNASHTRFQEEYFFGVFVI